MKYLNLGCGSHYSTEKVWTNLDFVSENEAVIAHNLLKGIPFNADSFDVVYHSHVLEHFTKPAGVAFIDECFRILKPGGILRVAIPDLEQIARNYIKYLELGLQYPGDPGIKANYEWMMLEMYDQVVRNTSGGEMGKYLIQENLINEEFVFERVGQEGKAIRNNYLRNKNSNENNRPPKSSLRRLLSGFRQKIRNARTDFRKSGENHLWMYDKYSMTRLLSDKGFKDISFKNAFESQIHGWNKFELDGKDGITRKPDSLFTEAVK